MHRPFSTADCFVQPHETSGMHGEEAETNMMVRKSAALEVSTPRMGGTGFSHGYRPGPHEHEAIAQIRRAHEIGMRASSAATISPPQ
jgi:hypothetical protein